MSRTVMIAAGGTGGHVFPGLATAAALVEAHPDLTIEFVGTADRLEATLVPDAGYTLHTVPAMALSRKLSLSTFKLPAVLLRAVRQVSGILRASDVVAAIGFGGYTSVPLALAARRGKVPLIVHEQNAVPGVANKLAARAAKAVAVTFEEAMGGFGSTPTVLTGNPVRPGLIPDGDISDSDISDGDISDSDEDSEDLRTRLRALRSTGLEHFGLEPTRSTLLVFGGSQGAQRINQALTGSVGGWNAPGELQILHAAGKRTIDQTRQDWQTSGVDPDGSCGPDGLKVRCVEFIEQMHLAYAAADLVVCRAGASSIAELTALGLPSLLVPYPYATADHQTVNARAVARAGGAVIMADAEVTSARMIAAVEPLLVDDDARARMARAAADFGRPDAAADVADLVARAAQLSPRER